MSATDLANIEAVINICANLSEILGVRYGFGFMIASLLIACLKKWRAAKNYFLLAAGAIVFGLPMPEVLYWAVTSIRNAHAEQFLWGLAVVCAAVALLAVVVAVWLWFLPFKIAKDRNKQKMGWIKSLSILGIFFVPLWSVALFLAYKNDKPDQDDNKAESAVGAQG